MAGPAGSGIFLAGVYGGFVWRRIDPRPARNVRCRAGVGLRPVSTPAAREFFGHALGVLGFTLMLMTETLYSLRKRTRAARWGRMSAWLEFHIFTGLVGPFLVLLHSSWKFNGLAGVVTLLTVIVVLSGFFGRYIYTAGPRTADGVGLAASSLAQEINRSQARINSWLATQP